MKKIIFLLSFIALILFSHSSFSQTFDWETATDNGSNVTQTVSTITATVTTSNSDAQSVNGSGFDGSTGFVVFTQNPDDSTSLTITFSTAVNVASMFTFIADNDAGGETSILYTPTGGSNSTVIEGITQSLGEVVTLNWTGITAITLTVNGGGFETFGVDDIVLAAADVTNPTLDSSLPADGATTIATSSNIVLTFNENIAFGTGNIQVIDVTDGTNSFTIDAASPGGQASITGAVLTINPSTSMDDSSNYAIQIAATAIDDTSGNSYAGITNNTTLDFTTADETGPFFNSSSPFDGATTIATSSNIVLTFDENIAFGTGNI
ncbi:MAG: Ig-like domain-containing protein, partial [Flavobacteriaceae bacterium]|nr:Ig-like domain-containing protein [Flavobacteriaceae bacterium]